MSRAAIFEGMYAILRSDPTLPTILGPATPTNLRILRAYSQLQSLLSTPPGYEPSGGEGWIVFQETESQPKAYTQQEETIQEYCDFDFVVYATRYSIADDVTDVLDEAFNWSIEQQRDVQFGERFLLMSNRLNTYEDYAQDIKMFMKTSWYRMTFVVDELTA